MAEGLGMRDGSGNKRVPPVIFLAPLPVIAAFLRGYFSGDGTFNGKYIEATTVSRGLAGDILTLLQYFGIVARCRKRAEWNGSTSYRIRFLWSEFLRRFINEIGFVEPERNQRVRDYLDNMTFKRDVQTPRGHITNDVLWDLVVEKRREPYAREHAWCITRSRISAKSSTGPDSRRRRSSSLTSSTPSPVPAAPTPAAGSSTRWSTSF
jgi:intein/homing endonuclease